jgi:hypothetical protein
MIDQTDNSYEYDFEPEPFVIEYRGVIAKLEAATSDIDRAEYRRIADGMKARWKRWQGEDSLHEMAFGEPWPGEI